MNDWNNGSNNTPFAQQHTPQDFAPKPVKKSHKWVHFVLYPVILFIGVAIGGAASSDPATDAVANTKPSPTKTVTAKPAPQSTVTTTVTQPAPEPVQTTTEAPVGAATTIDDDATYEVGVDIQPGTYKAKGDEMCYWARLKDTTGSFDSIIANNISKGAQTVTIKKTDGAFETTRCGTWTKVK